MTVTVESVTPWGKREDWCGDGSCGITEADDLRVLLRYEVSVPDDYEGDFDASRCPGELSVLNGNDDEALRPYQDLNGDTSDINGAILPGATKFGIAGFAVSKDYQDEEFVLTSACGTGIPTLTLADYAGLESDEFADKMAEAQEAEDALQKGRFIGTLNVSAGSASPSDSTSVDDQDSAAVADAEDDSLGVEAILPSDKELTEVIGVQWNTGRESVAKAESTLSNELANGISASDIEGVSPSSCAVSALAAGTGLPVDLQDSLVEHASAAKRPTSDIASDRLYFWGVDAYRLESGEAQRFMDLLADAGTTCQEATVLSASGTPMPFGALRSLDDKSGPSGSAYVAYSDIAGVVITEAIGDVIYVHFLDPKDKYLDRAANLYNEKMDELAAQAGIEREIVALG